MLGIVWRLDWFMSTFFRTQRRLSKYNANSLHSTDYISNKKIKKALNFEFQSIDSVVKEVVSLQKK
jgi:hypothetical protein